MEKVRKNIHIHIYIYYNIYNLFHIGNNKIRKYCKRYRLSSNLTRRNIRDKMTSSGII